MQAALPVFACGPLQEACSWPHSRWKRQALGGPSKQPAHALTTVFVIAKFRRPRRFHRLRRRSRRVGVHAGARADAEASLDSKPVSQSVDTGGAEAETERKQSPLEEGAMVNGGTDPSNAAEKAADMHGLKGQCVPIDESSFIPVPPEVLQEQLGNRLCACVGEPALDDSAAQVKLPDLAQAAVQELKNWGIFCAQLRALVHDELVDLREGLKDAYQPFDPSRKRWVDHWPLRSNEVKFAKEFLRTATLAGFTPLSRIDLERTRELKADLLSLPVTIDWDHLDSRWIESVFQEGLGEGAGSLEALSDFGGYVLALKRGISVERRAGRLLMQKLDFLQSRWLLQIGSLLQAILREAGSLSTKLWITFVPLGRATKDTVDQVLPQAAKRCQAALDKSAVAAGAQMTNRLVLQVRRFAVRAWPRALEFLRGIRMRVAGTQVLRRLQPGRYRYAQWLFGDVLSQGRWSRERAALIGRLSSAWEREVQLRGRLPEGLNEAEVERREALERGSYLERVGFEHLPFSWSSLLHPAELQEPQFQEILVVYRLQETSDLQGSQRFRLPPRREICVRRFFEVNMKDVKLILPKEAWRVRGRPLDMIRADLITTVGLLGVLFNWLGSSNKYLTLSPLVLLGVRTFLNYRRVRVMSNSVVSSMLFDKCLDKDAGLMRLLPDAAEAQVFAECALAYWVLLEMSSLAESADVPWVSEESLSQRAAVVLQEMVEEAGLPSAAIRPKLTSALQRLRSWGLLLRHREQASNQEGWRLRPAAKAGQLEQAASLLRIARAEQLKGKSSYGTDWDGL
eukprot:TRINITY_DN26748_c0_g1_i1.p1 TRINITY_DN26748_c0_g1~~TRINITY_DN26748_c0_g1_i1.p1  ORF type:complete len:797 (+),score=149.53 TRINITY_DN26748_c0_g1_i1:67-2457(+)